MKRNNLFLILFIFILSFKNQVTGAGPDYPSPAGYVSDFANVISVDDSRQMSSLIQDLKDKTKAEVAVVTLSTIGDETIEEYAVKLFEKWKIGEKGKDTGVLILLAVKERKVKIEVGYGLEGVIPDGLAGRIIDQAMIPYFKTGDFSSGLKNGTIGVVDLIKKEHKINGAKNNFEDEKNFVFFILIIFIVVIFSFIGKKFQRPYRSGPFTGGGYWGGGFGGGGFGGGGGGGFGGGFGGFGGGFSGGGGAGRGF
ncbi:MAG: TPM domain-containing protein [bacterium]